MSGTIRDLAIIILALQVLVIDILLAVMIWQIWRLAKIIQTDIKPVIEDTQETISTVRGTAVFVSDNVVDPVVRTTRSAARWRGTLSALRAELTPRRNPPLT